MLCTCRQPFNMSDLVDCTARVCDHSDMTQLDRLTRCRVLIAAARESVFVRNCQDCVLTIAWYALPCGRSVHAHNSHTGRTLFSLPCLLVCVHLRRHAVSSCACATA
ncbi:MAG: hypothetical protein EOO65_06220 [Methanosarcinales archaeon]|nr:MAG: hypothetical protein EOO65_06220 [Methanosarcinales archaeon]